MGHFRLLVNGITITHITANSPDDLKKKVRTEIQDWFYGKYWVEDHGGEVRFGDLEQVSPTVYRIGAFVRCVSGQIVWDHMFYLVRIA